MAKNKKQSDPAAVHSSDNKPRFVQRVTRDNLDNMPRYVQRVTVEGPKKKPVSEKNLKRRINRKLAKDMEALRTSRNWQMEMEAGRYYVVDFSHGGVIQSHVDLEDLGREIGVLKPYENLAD